MMPDSDKDNPEPSAPIPAIKMVMIGSGTGDGGAPITTGTVGTTPDHQPNIIIDVISPIVAVMVRFANTFLTSMVGILTGAGITGVIQASDFIHLVYKCAGLSLAPAGIGLIKDLITLLGGLEKKWPILTGNV